MKVSKWGNSLAIRIPAEDVSHLGLKVGDEVEAAITRKGSADEAERRKLIEVAWREFDKHRGQFRLPADYRFDRDDANARD